jgi:CubicO group peptidase (beta-lactamase class C family)
MPTIRLPFFLGILAALVLAAAASLTPITTAQTNSANQFVGLWEAKRRFGPDVRGALLLRQTGSRWQAEIAGRAAQAKMAGDSISFELPNGEGKFEGKFDGRRTKITGLWVQQRTLESGVHYAQPLTLEKYGRDIWRGNVIPLNDALTFYLMIKPRDDGSMGAFLRNPERNLGWTQYRVDYLERAGESVKLFAANKGEEKGRVVADGTYDAQREILSFYFQNRGGTYNFRRVAVNETNDFYPRGRPGATYVYAPPPELDDGWPTASLEDVGISREGIEKFIQMLIDTPIASVNAQEDHGILIARHGKLVLEEYFHGENRDKPHDTRSASKSIASDLTGAVIQAGVSLSPTDFVYKVMNDGVFPPDLETRKRALTLEHLLTMSSGFDCDEGDTKSAGFEDNMWEQTAQPDFYKWTLSLKMVRQPGEKAVYCSAGSNLAGGVVARAAKQSPQVLFQKLLAEPLQMKRYYLPLSPAGDFSLTGGARFPPREFMKLGQLHLNGGTWKGRKVFAPEWSRRATAHVVNIGATNRKYGYLWWVEDYPHQGRTVRAFFAAGNGGQIVMVVPELDLVMAFYAGNYNDVGGRQAQNVYVPKYILPTVDK